MTTRQQKWKDRCDEVAAWIQEHGRAPRRASDIPAEHSLHLWLGEARRQVRLGLRSKDEADRLESAITGVAFGVTTADRIKMIAAFHEEYGRLPLSTAPAGSHELELANALIQRIRPKIVKGTIKAEDLAALSLIPGAAVVRTVPDQEDTLAELVAYARQHGHMPGKGGSGTPDENRLASWWRNNTRGNAETKSPALRARHEALLELEAKYPGKAEAIFDINLALVENFVAANAHLPSHGPKATAEERKLASWLAKYLGAKPDDLPAEHRSRFQVLTAVPSRMEKEWAENFDALETFAAAHAGRLPGSWHEDPLFSWLTVQRRAFRNGKISEARLQKLLTIPGVISARTLAAAAAAAASRRPARA
jgi:hypothetical protein